MVLRNLHEQQVQALEAALAQANAEYSAAHAAAVAAQLALTQATSRQEAARQAASAAQKARAEEEVIHALRQQSALARYGVSDLGWLSPGAAVLNLQYGKALYQHALAAANNSNTWAGGSVAAALAYFGGNGFTLPRSTWFSLLSEARGWRFPMTGQDRPMSAKEWIAGLPAVLGGGQ